MSATPAATAASSRLDLATAVARYTADGATVYVGNFGAQLFAVGHELIRQGRRDLHLVMSSGGILLDQLVGAGCVGAATFAHCWSPVGPSPTWNFRRAVEGAARTPVWREVSLGTLNAALTAAAWDVAFCPTIDVAATGYVTADWSKGLVTTVDSPFGSALVARALPLDIAFVHVDACDRAGNGWLRGPLGEALLAAQAAAEVVLVAETVEVPDGHGPADLPAVLVSAVVHEPLAVHPDGAAGRYERDVSVYSDYASAAATAAGFDHWLQRWVTGLPDRSAYRVALEEAARA